jgi:hypothetical protein
MSWKSVAILRRGRSARTQRARVTQLRPHCSAAQKLTRRILSLCVVQALSIKDGGDFQHILRILGTNVDGKQKVMYAMTSVKGIGRRFSNIVCKKADVDMDKRAG